MGIHKFSKKKVEYIIVISRGLVILSSFKQRIYCNVEKLVYCGSTRTCSSILPKIDIDFDIILEKDQVNRYAMDDNLKPDIEKLCFFLEHGCVVYILIHKNLVVGRYVLCDLARFKPYQYLNHSLFRKCTYYIFFCRTFESYMGNNIYKFALNKILKDRQKDTEQIFISCDPANIASKRAIIGAGFRKIGVLKYTSLYCLFRRDKLRRDIGVRDG